MSEASPLVQLKRLGCQGFLPVCTTGAALFQRAGRCTAGTATCDDSFNVEIPISGDGGDNRFLP